MSNSRSSALAQFVTGLQLSEVPDDVVHAAVHHIIDTIGAALAGSVSVGSPALRQQLVRAYGASVPGSGMRSSAGATVWGDRDPTAPALAALLNGVSAHAEDFDDTHSRGILHGSACIVPAAWAAAEEAAGDGADIVRAVIAGWEVASRVALAAAGRFHERGWHTTSVAGVFGATAAAASVWGLTAEELTEALGLAGSMASGINAYLENGSRAKTLHPGLAAQNGLIAALLARGGLTGPQRVFEGRHGVFEVYADAPGESLEGLVDGLGASWELLDVSLKPFPACHFAHASIEGALELRKRGVSPDELERVVCHVPRPTFPLICDPWEEKLQPRTPYAAKFSLPFLVAVALVDGTVERDSFRPEHIARPAVQTVMAKVEHREWERSPFPETYPGRVVAYERAGSIQDVTVEVNLGHPRRPLSEAQVLDKFVRNARTRVPQEHAERLGKRLGELPEMDEGDLRRLLAGPLGHEAGSGRGLVSR